MDNNQYFCLRQDTVEAIQNFPPSNKPSRTVNFYLRDGSARSCITVIGNEFYALPGDTKYFEPADIVMVEEYSD